MAVIGFANFLFFGPQFMADPSNVSTASAMVNGVLLITLAILLERGDRERAKRVALVLAALPMAIGWGILTPALNAAGPNTLGLAVTGWCLAFIFAGLVYKPRFSFYLLYGGMTGMSAICSIVQFAGATNAGSAVLVRTSPHATVCICARGARESPPAGTIAPTFPSTHRSNAVCLPRHGGLAQAA